MLKALQEFFKNITNQHYYNTTLYLPQVRTTHYGLQSIKHKSAKCWSEIQSKTSNKRNIDYWSKNRLSKSLKNIYSTMVVSCFDVTLPN